MPSCSASKALLRSFACATSFANGIVKRRYVAAINQRGIDAQAGWPNDAQRPPRAWLESGARILRINAGFDRMAVTANLVLRERQRLARRDPQLPFDQVKAGDRFGDGVLDLEPSIDLEKIERGVGVEYEFESAGVDISERACAAHSRIGHSLS